MNHRPSARRLLSNRALGPLAAVFLSGLSCIALEDPTVEVDHGAAITQLPPSLTTPTFVQTSSAIPFGARSSVSVSFPSAQTAGI